MNPIGINFPAKYAPIFEPHRYKVLYGGRGRGASWTIGRTLLLLCGQYTLRVLCAREIQSSIAESSHRLLSQQIAKLGLQDQYIIEKTSIRHRITKSEFIFEGIKFNVDKIRSTEDIDICWVEEANKVSAASWRVLIPTIRKSEYPEGHILKESEIWVSFNPDLESDYTYEYFIKNTPPDCALMFGTYRDNPWFPPALTREMEHLKATNYEDYLVVYEGQCRSLTAGAVYGYELKDAMDEERLTRVPYMPGIPVTTYWDLGRRGMTSIIFTQTVGAMEHVIHTYENRKYDIDHYMRYLQNKKYFYGYCILPHDAAQLRLGMKASIKKQVQDYGFKVKVVPKDLISTGIEHVRTLFPRLMVDANECEDFLHAIRHYRYEVLEAEVGGVKVLSKEPLKDGVTDHYADALRMKGTAHKLWPSHTLDFSPHTRKEQVRPKGRAELRRGHKSGNRGVGWMLGR